MSGSLLSYDWTHIYRAEVSTVGDTSNPLCKFSLQKAQRISCLIPPGVYRAIERISEICERATETGTLEIRGEPRVVSASVALHSATIKLQSPLRACQKRLRSVTDPFIRQIQRSSAHAQHRPMESAAAKNLPDRTHRSWIEKRER